MSIPRDARLIEEAESGEIPDAIKALVAAHEATAYFLKDDHSHVLLGTNGTYPRILTDTVTKQSYMFHETSEPYGRREKIIFFAQPLEEDAAREWLEFINARK